MFQSGTDTFDNEYSLTASKTVTFPTPLNSTTNVQIVATLQRTFKSTSLRNIAVITYDPATLTTTGVTFTVILNNGYVGKMKFDYIVVGDTTPLNPSFLLMEEGGYILLESGDRIIIN